LEKGLDERALTRLCSDFRKGMSTRREALLDDYAQEFLAQFGIDEPVVWHPPLNLLVDLPLPGPG